jgi:hypothetical protein
MNSVTGECLCGQISVSVTREAFNATDNTCLCHCKNCRQCGGALASIVAIIPDSAVKITGQPKIYLDGNTTSGASVQRAFCSNCGCPIYTVPPSLPGCKIIKLGLFDEIPKPSMELFCKRRPSWNKPIDGAKQFNTSPNK